MLCHNCLKAGDTCAGLEKDQEICQGKFFSSSNFGEKITVRYAIMETGKCTYLSRTSKSPFRLCMGIERATWFDTKKKAENAMKKLNEKFPSLYGGEWIFVEIEINEKAVESL